MWQPDSRSSRTVNRSPCFDMNSQAVSTHLPGRELAAVAAAALYDLTESVRSGRKTLEQVVLMAWEEPPAAVRKW